LVTNSNVSAAIQKAKAERQKRTEVTQDYVIEKLKEIADKPASDCTESDLKYANKLKALEMLASGTDRKPGFSVEGRALERDKNNPKKVTKALITNVAMTMTPVNANSFADIVKGVQTVDFVESNKEEISNGSNNVLVELQKDGYNIKIDKSFNVTINPIIVERDERFQELYKYYLNGNVGLNVIKDYLRTVNK
jgi:hypothetical protein